MYNCLQNFLNLSIYLVVTNMKKKLDKFVSYSFYNNFKLNSLKL